MKAKKRSLASSMLEAAGQSSPEKAALPKESAPVIEETPVKSTKSKSRSGTRAVGGHFPPEVQKQLKMIAVENDTTNQLLLAEALNLLFQKYDKPPIA